MSNSTVNTSAITRALRKSDLPEYKVLERNLQKKIVKEQVGWLIEKHEGYATIGRFRDDMPHWGEVYTHPEYTSPHYAELMEWIDSVVAVLTDAGLRVEVVKVTRRAGRLHHRVVEVVKEIRVWAGEK